MINTPEVKKIYANLQKQLFYLIPEKWDKIYLYASVSEQILNIETGELFFYYFPKGILKKNPVNVYEIPSRFNLDEDSYIHLVEQLYGTIKRLRKVYKDNGAELWSNITVRIVGLKFEIEFNYENLTYSKYSGTERHIIWKYKNLGIPLETFNKKERKLIENYLTESVIDLNISETYKESMYKRPIKNVIQYNKEKVAEEDMYIPEKVKDKEKDNSQKYTYIKQDKKSLKKQYVKEEKKQKEITYIEQIEKQKNATKSQILSHL